MFWEPYGWCLWRLSANWLTQWFQQCVFYCLVRARETLSTCTWPFISSQDNSLFHALKTTLIISTKLFSLMLFFFVKEKNKTFIDTLQCNWHYLHTKDRFPCRPPIAAKTNWFSLYISIVSFSLQNIATNTFLESNR